MMMMTMMLFLNYYALACWLVFIMMSHRTKQSARYEKSWLPSTAPFWADVDVEWGKNDDNDGVHVDDYDDEAVHWKKR